ncbi:hypothetical protein OEZ85_005792 [Tetradesmus obliquus]|uniref:Uncharacterized protein n=1 Tax=Tetradesmus obliquus TaxID=3088 RepID=A0ABY8UHU5_TETOB|nr:hypothetical protein OEZ85_005792 [Tetradesmus obliquus]
MEGSYSGDRSPTWDYQPPELGVRTLLGDQALSFPGTEFAVRPQVRQLGKFRSSRKGRIRVNKEVLAVLKQVSAELDAAQRHYLAYKQFGDAGESILKISPELFFLPPDGATGVPAAAADAGAAGADEQDGAAADPASTGASANGAAPAEDLLVGHRRWGYFPMMARLRAVSAKPRKPPPQQVQLNVSAAGAAAPADAAAAAEAQDDWDGLPDSPKSNWMEVMKQKKRAKEDGIAQMIHIKHAVLIIQRAWRKHLQKRASRALAMMMLRAKVRRAHRAAYVSNLLRRKPTAAAGLSTAGAAGSEAGSSSMDGGIAGAGDLEDGDEVELTAQQEQELQQALQHVLEEGQLSMADIAELQLTDLLQKVAAAKDSEASAGAGDAAQESESEEEQEEEEEQQAGGWKVLSKPTSPVKRPLALRVDTEAPAGNGWQGSLRTPGTTRPSTTRLGTPPTDPDSPSGPRTHRSMSRRSGISFGRSMRPKTGSKDGGNAAGNESGSAGSSVYGGSSCGSPRSPGGGYIGGGEDSSGLPKRASVSRGALKSAGGVRVGKSSPSHMRVAA